MINFEQKIDPAINQKVVQLATAIRKANSKGILSIVPAYCSLLVRYDAVQIGFEAIQKTIQTIANSSQENIQHSTGRKWRIPVCYEDSFAWDKEDVMQQTGLSWEEIVALHTQQSFRVYMLGFLPGFAYMGKLPNALSVQRKEIPRKKIEAGMVAIAGQQTGIYPTAGPGGWQIIGRTPLTVIDGNREQLFLFEAGDEVQFHAVTINEFKAIEAAILAGTYQLEEKHG